MTNTCSSLEIQPRISQTPLCTQITVRLCLPSLPAPSHLLFPYLLCTSSSQPTITASLLSRACCQHPQRSALLSSLAETNPGKPPPCPCSSYTQPGSSLEVLAQQPGWNHRLTVQSSTTDGSHFLPEKLSCMALVFFSLLRKDGCL